MSDTACASDPPSRPSRRARVPTGERSSGDPAYPTRPGSRFPPGATALPDGVNFCIFSRHATRVELLLYAEADSPEPFQVITLTPEHNRTFFFWHVFVEGLPPRTLLHLACRRTDGHAADGPVLQPAQGAARSVGAGRDRCAVGPAQGRGPAGCRARRAARDRDGAAAAATRPSRSARTRRRDHLRAPCRRLHASSLERREASGHLRRRDREDPLPPRRSASRTSSCCR